MCSRRQAGFTMLEAIVTVTIFVVGIIGLIQLSLAARSSSDAARDTVQVSNYLQEGIEAVRTLRDNAWDNVKTAGTYHLVSQAGTNPPWQLVSGGTETISGKYSRTVTISVVTREDTDGSGTLTAGDKIAPTGGTLADDDTKKVTVTITWNVGSRSYTKSIYEYLTNWQ